MTHETANHNSTEAEDNWQPQPYEPDTIHNQIAHEAWRHRRTRERRRAGVVLAAGAVLTAALVVNAQELAAADEAGVAVVAETISE